MTISNIDNDGQVARHHVSTKMAKDAENNRSKIQKKTHYKMINKYINNSFNVSYKGMLNLGMFGKTTMFLW